MGVNDGNVERREIRRNEGDYGRRGAFGAQGCGERSQVFLAIQAEAGRPIGLHDSTGAGQTSRTGKGREGRKALPFTYLLWGALFALFNFEGVVPRADDDGQ